MKELGKKSFESTWYSRLLRDSCTEQFLERVVGTMRAQKNYIVEDTAAARGLRKVRYMNQVTNPKTAYHLLKQEQQ